MKAKLNLIVLLLVASLGAGTTVRAEDKADDQKETAGASQTGKEQAGEKRGQGERLQANGGNRTPPVYVPPLRGAPLSRVGGGTRGVDDSIPTVSVVTPEHTGYTSTARPSLFWYLSEKHPARIEVALINDHAIDPVLETALPEQPDAGINRIDLERFGVILKPGVAYQWSVALVSDAAQRSSDIVASGRVQYAPLSDAQRSALESADPEDAVMIYARGGYWYDAFALLSELIAAHPEDRTLRRQRIALLEQVGLDEVAAYDRSQLAD